MMRRYWSRKPKKTRRVLSYSFQDSWFNQKQISWSYLSEHHISEDTRTSDDCLTYLFRHLSVVRQIEKEANSRTCKYVWISTHQFTKICLRLRDRPKRQKWYAHIHWNQDRSWKHRRLWFSLELDSTHFGGCFELDCFQSLLANTSDHRLWSAQNVKVLPRPQAYFRAWRQGIKV